MLPRFPIYVPTRDRWQRTRALTTRFLLADGVPFHAVVEREEAERYAELVGAERLLVLPESGRGLWWARNWIRDHAEAAGHAWHWQLDDNIRQLWRRYRGRRLPCQSGPALRVVEDLASRYENVAISGLTYYMFGIGRRALTRNVHIYSASLVNHACPQRWRLTYN